MSTFMRRIALALKERCPNPSRATGGRFAVPAGGGIGGGGERRVRSTPFTLSNSVRCEHGVSAA
jgi:hypothetical protein